MPDGLYAFVRRVFSARSSPFRLRYPWANPSSAARAGSNVERVILSGARIFSATYCSYGIPETAWTISPRVLKPSLAYSQRAPGRSRSFSHSSARTRRSSASGSWPPVSEALAGMPEVWLRSWRTVICADRGSSRVNQGR